MRRHTDVVADSSGRSYVTEQWHNVPLLRTRALNVLMVKRWRGQFTEGQTNVHDEDHNGAWTDEKCAARSFAEPALHNFGTMGGSPGDLSENPVTWDKRKKGWSMSCDVGEATEELENELGGR